MREMFNKPNRQNLKSFFHNEVVKSFWWKYKFNESQNLPQTTIDRTECFMNEEIVDKIFDQENEVERQRVTDIFKLVTPNGMLMFK